jgi:hypothetical protein
MSSALDFFFFYLKFNMEHHPSMGSQYEYICYGVCEKDNTLDLSTSMTCALDLLNPKFDRDHLSLMGSLYVRYGDTTWEG